MKNKSTKIMLSVSLLIECSDNCIKGNNDSSKAIGLIGFAGLMAKAKEKGMDEDTALADSIKIVTTHDDLVTIRLNLSEELEQACANVAPALTQYDFERIDMLSSVIRLIDMVGELMVGEQEKEQHYDIHNPV